MGDDRAGISAGSLIGTDGNKIDVHSDLNQKLSYRGNLGVEIVATTRDKISNALHESLPKYDLRRAWVGPSGLFLTLLLTLLTADFKDIRFNPEQVFISGEVLQGACGLATLACLVLTVRSLLGLREAFDHGKVLNAILNTSDEDDPSS